MRRFQIGAIALVLAFAPVLSALAEQPAVQAATLKIPMEPGSAEKIQKALGALPGVAQVEVSEEAGLAVVVYDPAKVQAQAFTDAMRSAGYLATLAKANYRCPTCPAVYEEDGRCIVDESELEEISIG